MAPLRHPCRNARHHHAQWQRLHRRHREHQGVISVITTGSTQHRPASLLLLDGGNLLFVPEAEGTLVAYDAGNGKKLWSHNLGTGSNGGTISYMAKGKQYVAVMTGWGSLVGDGYGDLWGEPWKSMPKDAGILKVFALD